MKKSIILTVVMVFTLVFSIEAKFRGESKFNYFYQTLEPYGEWIELDYNNYVWRPIRVSQDWSPYSEGRWVWSDDGWYWDSYEQFGWATYHYGRWYYDRHYGWVWTPGDEWAPAWVEWRYDNDYIGWAPLPPYAYYNSNSGIHFSITWNSPYTYWKFVKYNRFTDRYVWKHRVEKYSIKRFFDRTRHVTNYHTNGRRIVNRGIDRSVIEKRGRIKINRTELNNVTKIRERSLQADDRNSVSVYRPGEIEVSTESRNRTYDFQKTSNSFLLREKADVKTGSRNKTDIRKQVPERTRNTSNNIKKDVSKSDRASNVFLKKTPIRNISRDRTLTKTREVNRNSKTTKNTQTQSKNKTVSKSRTSSSSKKEVKAGRTTSTVISRDRK